MINILRFTPTHLALFSTNKWMHKWALLDITPLLTSRVQNLGHLFIFQTLLWKAAKVKDCFASQSHPIIMHTEKCWSYSPLFTIYSSLKILEMLFSFLHPQTKGSHWNLPNSTHFSTVKWLICENNLSPNQIMQKRNAVLPVLLLETEKGLKDLPVATGLQHCCGFLHSWLVFLNILFKMSHPNTHTHTHKPSL